MIDNNLPAPSLLLVDDDERLRTRLARAFRERGYTVHTAANYAEAVSKTEDNSPNMAVIDLRMPGPSGLELIPTLKKLNSEIKMLVLTGYGSITTTVDAMRLGAIYYLQKPADADDILAAFAKTDATLMLTDVQETPSLDRVKWEHMSRVLTDCGGNISAAARQLNLHRRSLQRMLQKSPPR